MNVLLIDDERDFTELAGTLLDFHDITVEAVNDPVVVEERVKTNKFDLIVTDIMMPKLNGFQVIETVRAQAHNAAVPIIVLTAKPLTDEERKFLLRNDAHFLMKPFEPLALVEMIRGLTAA